MSVVSLEERRRGNAERARKSREKRGVLVATPQGFRSTCSVCGDEFFAPTLKVRVCGEGGCARVLRRKRLVPFTIRHFERWAAGVILDNDKPWRLEEFQRRFLEDLFAGVPECWLLVGEGNTKTTLLAGVGLYHCQFRRGGRVPIAASSRDQAELMYLQAEGMVERSEGLYPVFRCQEGLRRIKCDSMASRIQVFAADDRTGDGVIFTLALLDELHRHRDMKLYRTWSGKRRKRGGQLCAISTAGEPGSEFELTRDQIRQSATEREVDGGFTRALSGPVVLHEYAVPEGADVADMHVAKLANPFSGITLKALREKRDSPTMTLEHWRRFTCNLATRGVNAAITEAEWFAQVTDVQIPTGVPVWAGLDVAWKSDCTALVPLWVRDPEFRLFGPAAVLTPPRNGNMLDVGLVEDALLELHDRNPIHTLVMDMHNAADVAQWAEDHLGCEIVDRAQTPVFFALDYEQFMEALRHRWLWHAGDPGLTRHVLNATAQVLPGGKIRFNRPQRSRGGGSLSQDARVIDALTAAAMVHTTAAGELVEGAGVVYG